MVSNVVQECFCLNNFFVLASSFCLILATWDVSSIFLNSSFNSNHHFCILLDKKRFLYWYYTHTWAKWDSVGILFHYLTHSKERSKSNYFLDCQYTIKQTSDEMRENYEIREFFGLSTKFWKLIYRHEKCTVYSNENLYREPGRERVSRIENTRLSMLPCNILHKLGNLVLTTELITLIGHHKEFKSWCFKH